MISNEKMKAISDLDLDPIKTKLMHVESGEGWSAARANTVETEYRRFLCLMKVFPHEQTAPLVDVDTFWHYHILDTMKYAADCERAFGYFLHHYPYLGMGAGDDAQRHAGGERMCELYEQIFGESYLQAAAAVQRASAFCAAANDPAFCAATAKPAFCASPAKSAFCAASTKPAFCAATAKPAFCAATVGTAFCAAANQAAFCAATAKSAFCASPGKSASCAATTKTAFCANAGGTWATWTEGPARQAMVGT